MCLPLEFHLGHSIQALTLPQLRLTLLCMFHPAGSRAEPARCESLAMCILQCSAGPRKTLRDTTRRGAVKYDWWCGSDGVMFTQTLKELRELQRRLQKGALEVQEYGRQQLNSMLSVGPYSFLQVPLPSCNSSISDDSTSQVLHWKRTAVADAENNAAKVCCCGSFAAIARLLCMATRRAWAAVLFGRACLCRSELCVPCRPKQLRGNWRRWQL
jgi:hypothetical protein